MNINLWRRSCPGTESDQAVIQKLIELLLGANIWFCEIHRVIRPKNNITYRYYRYENLTIVCADGGILKQNSVFLEGIFSKYCIYKDGQIQFKSRRQRTKILHLVSSWINILEE